MYSPYRGRSQTPVSQIIDDYASTTSEDEAGQARSAPQSYQRANINHPGGSSTTIIRRNLSTRETGEERKAVAFATTPRAAKGACRTVLARSSDGSIVRVQRPVRDSELFMRSQTRTPDRQQTPPSVRSASIYDDDASRDTMLSTMTLVETALAEQQTFQRSQGARRLGHSVNGSNATGASGTSGNIEIGHFDENEEYEQDRRYSASDYGDAGDHTTEFERDDNNLTHPRSRSAHESYETSNARAAFRDGGPPPNAVLRSPPPAIRYSDDSSTSTLYTDKSRGQARDTCMSTATDEALMKPWLQRVVRLCSYILASCSVVLPLAFVALGIAAIVMRGKLVSSSWSSVADLIEITAIVWPIVFATAVAQCFKAGIIFRVKGGPNGRLGTCTNRHLTLPSLEACCLLVFLIWCLSPIGPQAARHMYGVSQESLQGSRDVLYVENTGHNEVWAPKSTNALSSISRSELIQAIGAKYIRSLSQDNSNNALHEPTSIYSPSKSTFIDSIVSASGSMDHAALPHGVRPRGALINSAHEGVSIPADFKALNFSMTASAFDFNCGDWTLMTRQLSNDTSSGHISYSASQTLGLSMSGLDDPTSPAMVHFVSLNRKSISNHTTVLRRRRRDTTNLTIDQWEYSSISCSYEQVFYNVPMHCSRDDSTGLNTCAQSAAAQLMPSDEVLNTPLGDFALDFVWSGNLPTTDKTATATEQYIQRGGPFDTKPRTRARQLRGSRFNLSATVSPDEFAQRFGHLFSTWVGLGYCPQCSSGVVVNSTSIPANLQTRYKKASSTITWPGERVYTVNWAWVAVYLVFTSILLVAAVSAIVVESMVLAKAAKNKRARRTISKSDIVPLRLPTMYSTVSNGQISPQWGKSVMQDMNSVTGAGYSWRMYG